MAIDVEIGEAGTIRGVKQFGGLCEIDQDVGLRWTVPARIPAFLRDGFIERRDAAAGLLQLRAQGLKGGKILLL